MINPISISLPDGEGTSLLEGSLMVKGGVSPTNRLTLGSHFSIVESMNPRLQLNHLVIEFQVLPEWTTIFAFTQCQTWFNSIEPQVQPRRGANSGRISQLERLLEDASPNLDHHST